MKARALHGALEDLDWIEGIMAAGGEVGAGPSCMWVFKLESYASLGRLFSGSEPVSKAYVGFFNATDDLEDRVRGEVTFV